MALTNKTADALEAMFEGTPEAAEEFEQTLNQMSREEVVELITYAEVIIQDELGDFIDVDGA